jgi:hypothetical protein
VRLSKRRERKRLRRQRVRRRYKDSFTTFTKDVYFRQAHDRKLIDTFKTDLDTFLNNNGNSSLKASSSTIQIPKVFSFEEDYNSTIRTLAWLRKSLMELIGVSVIIDFKSCKRVDFSSLFLLKVILDEYIRSLKALNVRLLAYNSLPTIVIQHSLDGDVNMKLLANQLIPATNSLPVTFIPISSMKLMKGTKSQKHYAENRKGVAATDIRKYLNWGLQKYASPLDADGESSLDGIISEILNNAEDHSPWNTWFAFANLFEVNRLVSNSEVVAEVNLAFLNFGFSIFEGFEETKEENEQIYQEMEQLYNKVKSTKTGKHFTKENLFTLYALQEGTSRLKYERESRGTGTMKFIKSFLALSDFSNSKFTPHLLIYSGNTHLKCTNEFKPFNVEGVNYLSLNATSNLGEPPEKSHLQSLSLKFPGTLLIVKIYLNKNHLRSKI